MKQYRCVKTWKQAFPYDSYDGEGKYVVGKIYDTKLIREYWEEGDEYGYYDVECIVDEQGEYIAQIGSEVETDCFKLV